MGCAMSSDAASSFGLSRLQQALLLNNPVNVIRGIVREYPESIRKRDLCGSLPLHYAASLNASVQVIELLVDEYRKAVEEQDYLQCLPLHYAAQSNASTEVVRLLVVANRAAVEVPDHLGCLPLHHAAARKSASTEVVKLLVATCPRTLFVKNNKGKRPVDAYRTRKNPAVAAYLKQAMTMYRNLSFVPPTPASVGQPQHPLTTPTEINLDDHVPVSSAHGPFSASLYPSHQQDRDRV
jgi:Ankyrin repeats (3 copies)